MAGMTDVHGAKFIVSLKLYIVIQLIATGSYSKTRVSLLESGVLGGTRPFRPT